LPKVSGRTRRARAVIPLCLLLVVALGGMGSLRAEPGRAAAPYGLEKRTLSRAYLGMPETAGGKIPERLSQTGVFRDLRTLAVNPGLVPYDLVVPFWSDGARKERWMAVPAGKVGFAPTGEWKFPPGTVFVKTFELPTDASHPELTRRLETRLLVVDSAGGVYGVVYKWRPDGSDADLLTSSLTEDVLIRSARGDVHQQTWYYPSREDCLKCHNTRAGGVLGLKTQQLNRDFTYPSGITDNELRALSHLGLFEPALKEADIAGLPKLAAPDDTSASLEERARSYLDANCSQCHRPGGTVANFDARYDTPLEQQQLVDGPVLINQGIDRARVFSPHDIWRSIAYMRVNTAGDIRMPPVGRETIDTHGVALLRDWITSMPGRSVLAPPVIAPEGGSFAGPVEVSLKESEPGAEIRYTLDGSIPGTSDPLYQEPIRISGPTVVRARAYKEGFTRSITAQQVFVVGK
jgi:uncharacterized repeat protein (TIGR03806 family)